MLFPLRGSLLWARRSALCAEVKLKLDKMGEVYIV